MHCQAKQTPKKKACNFVGGVLSPLLANVYLHEVLDTWLEMVVKAHCRGQVVLWRYADDFVRHEARIMHGASAPTADQRAVSLSP